MEAENQFILQFCSQATLKFDSCHYVQYLIGLKGAYSYLVVGNLTKLVKLNPNFVVEMPQKYALSDLTKLMLSAGKRGRDLGFFYPMDKSVVVHSFITMI